MNIQMHAVSHQPVLPPTVVASRIDDDLIEAVQKVHGYILGGVSDQEVESALAHLVYRDSGMKAFCQEIWKTFFLDDWADRELKRVICLSAYKGILRRANQLSVAL